MGAGSRHNTLGIEIDATAHAALTAGQLAALRDLFDAEYLDDFGAWNPDQPYGYSPHDHHIIARNQVGAVMGHVGWARRAIGVAGRDVVIAGVGGVLISDDARGAGLGERLITRAAESMKAAGGIDFGYLGCRESVVPFYVSCGWSRISAVECSLDRTGHPVADPPGQPLLILPIDRNLEDWPEGDIHLRGRAW